MRETLEIVGDPSGRSGGPRLVLVDDACYRREAFERYRTISTGRGVETLGGEDCGGVLRGRAEGKPREGVRALFFCTVDTHVKTLAPVIRQFESYRALAPILEEGGARSAFEREGLRWENHGPSFAPFRWADVGICACDWGYEDRWFIAQCRKAGIPSVCLQEGTNVDFGPYPYRMEYADMVMVQGAYSLKYLNRKLAFMTGNPRYDAYAALARPQGEKVLINSNFLFNQGHDRGRAWVERVISAVESLGLDYFISAHPRDASDLTGLGPIVRSGAYSIFDQLRDCSMVVSRDSSIPHEALLCNRHAIYFNPFGEMERHLNEDDYGLIKKARDAERLCAAIQSCLGAPGPRESTGGGAVLEAYFGPLDGLAHARVANAIALAASLSQWELPGDGRRDALAVARWRTAIMRQGRRWIRPYPRLRSLWRWIKTTAHPPGH